VRLITNYILCLLFFSGDHKVPCYSGVRGHFEDMKDVADDPASLDDPDDPDFMDMVEDIIDDGLISKPISNDFGASSINIYNDDTELNALIGELVDFTSTQSNAAPPPQKRKPQLNIMKLVSLLS